MCSGPCWILLTQRLRRICKISPSDLWPPCASVERNSGRTPIPAFQRLLSWSDLQLGQTLLLQHMGRCPSCRAIARAATQRRTLFNTSRPTESALYLWEDDLTNSSLANYLIRVPRPLPTLTISRRQFTVAFVPKTKSSHSFCL
jgi:hypothetical protein